MAQTLRETDEPGGLSNFLRAVRWRWRLVLAVVVPASLLGVGYVSLLPPTATAVSVVSLVPQQADAAFGDLVNITTSRYAVSMTASPRLQQVSDATGVSVDDLQQSVSVEVNPVDANMRITASAETPELATAVADAVADSAVIAEASNSNLLQMTKVAPAAVQPTPATSSPMLLRLVLILAALALGLWVAFLMERLRPRVVDESDAERITGVPTLGTISRSSREVDLTAMLETEKSSAQARVVRTGLRATEDGAALGLTVTGVAAGVGVATTAYLVSRSLASVGAHVLLVDGDTEDTMLSNQVGVDQGVPLGDLVGGRALMSPAGPSGQLCLVTAVPGTFADEDVLARGLKAVVGEAGGRWERVVVSSASMDGSGIAESALAATSRAVLVIPRGTDTTSVREAVRRVKRLSGGLAGTVVYEGTTSP